VGRKLSFSHASDGVRSDFLAIWWIVGVWGVEDCFSLFSECEEKMEKMVDRAQMLIRC
jgi:hypothetical protein